MGEWVWIERYEPAGAWGIIFLYMIYPFMFLATIAMCVSSEPLQNVIPGHPLLSFLVVACGVMVLTFLIMQLDLIGSAFSALCCMILLCAVFEVILSFTRPDSVQYYILVTVIFSAICIPLCLANLKNGSGGVGIKGVSCTVAGILNVITVAIYILIIKTGWEVFCVPEGTLVIESTFLENSFLGELEFFPIPEFASMPGAVTFYIVLAVICIGVFAASIIFRNRLYR